MALRTMMPIAMVSRLPALTRFLYPLHDLPEFGKTAGSHEQAQQEPRDPLPACGERMERGNGEGEKWRIEIVPASGVCDSVGVAAIEERSARLGVDGKSVRCARTL